MTSKHRRILRPALLLTLAIALLAGCGGGGGGGGSSSSGPQIVTITGVLQDTATSTRLPSRTVVVRGTSLSAVTDATGTFTIAGVTAGAITLTITDSSGVSDGTYSVDVSKLSGNPRSLGTISLTISNGTGGPPPVPVVRHG